MAAVTEFSPWVEEDQHDSSMGSGQSHREEDHEEANNSMTKVKSVKTPRSGKAHENTLLIRPKSTGWSGSLASNAIDDIVNRKITYPLAETKIDSSILPRTLIGGKVENQTETERSRLGKDRRNTPRSINSLSSENEVLKTEVHTLKKALLAGMRGNGRYHANSYLKTIKGADTHNHSSLRQSSSVPVLDNSSNSLLDGLSGRKAAPGSENGSLHALRAQRLEQELSFRSRELFKVRAELDEVKSKLDDNNKLKKQIASLQAQIKYSKYQHEKEKLEEASGNTELAHAKKQMAEKDKTISYLFSELSKLREESAAATEALKDTKQNLEKKIEEAKFSSLAAKEESRVLKKQMHILSEEKRHLESEVKDLSTKGEEERFESTVGSSGAQEAQNEILVSRVLDAEQAVRKAQERLEESCCENKKLRRTIEDLEDQLDHFGKKASVERMRVENANVELSQSRVHQAKLENLVDVLRRELSETRIKLSEAGAKINLHESERIDGTKNHLELRQLESHLESIANLFEERPDGTSIRSPLFTKWIKEYLGELCSARERLCHAEKYLEDEGASKAALQAELRAEVERREAAEKFFTKEAVRNVVRLCVIAPTVNVSISNVGSSLVKQFSVKAKTPEEEITKILQEQVLPRYSKMFLQQDKSLGPDKKSPLNVWVSTFVREMHRSVENQVRLVFSDAKVEREGSLGVL